MTPKLHKITTFVNVGLETAFLEWYTDVIMNFPCAALYLPSCTGSLVICHQTEIRRSLCTYHVGTVVCLIPTFRSTTDRIYDGVPIRL
jgi:hypothetical protein